VGTSDKPPDTETADCEALRGFVVRDVALPTAIMTVAALAMVPFQRLVVWLALLLLPGVLAYHVARPCGITAAAVSALLYAWAHGNPRFSSTVTDQWTIRWSFLLGMLGVLGACVADWYWREKLASVPGTGSRDELRGEAAPER
jgi:hypothetical protein